MTDNPSVSEADTSLYTREALNGGNKVGFRKEQAPSLQHKESFKGWESHKKINGIIIKA